MLITKIGKSGGVGECCNELVMSLGAGVPESRRAGVPEGRGDRNKVLLIP